MRTRICKSAADFGVKTLSVFGLSKVSRSEKFSSCERHPDICQFESAQANFQNTRR